MSGNIRGKYSVVNPSRSITFNSQVCPNVLQFLSHFVTEYLAMGNMKEGLITDHVSGAGGSPPDADDGGHDSGPEGRSQGGDEEQGGQIRRRRQRRGWRHQTHGGV